MRALLALAVVLGPTIAHAQAAIATETLDGELQLASDGQTLVVAVDTDKAARLRFYDFATHKQTGTARALGKEKSITLIDGKTFLASTDNALGVYANANASPAIATREKTFRSTVRSIATRGGVYAVAGTNDDAVISFDGKQVRRIDLGQFDPEAGRSNAVAFSPDGKRVAVGTTAHFVFEIDVAAWKVQRKILRADGAINALAYTRDGALLVIGVDTGGDSLIVVDTATGKPVDGPKKAPTNGVNVLAFSADGAYLAVGGAEQRIHVYAVAGWKQKAFLDGHFNPVTAMSWSGDGKYLASSAAGELRLWAPFGE